MEVPPGYVGRSCAIDLDCDCGGTDRKIIVACSHRKSLAGFDKENSRELAAPGFVRLAARACAPGQSAARLPAP
jgi:hypothetical protein